MKHRKILAALAALLLLAGCGTAGNANPTAMPVQAEPVETAAPETPVPTPETTPAPETDVPEAPAVVPEELWTYSDHYSEEGPLQAWDGYGALLPYFGAMARMGEDNLDPYTPAYGLCTSRGQLVTGPLYVDLRYEAGFLVLLRFDGQTTYTTLAAQDGSWVGEETANSFVCAYDGVAVLKDSEGGLYFWNSRGEPFLSVPAEQVADYLQDLQEKDWWTFSPRLMGLQDHILYAVRYVAGDPSATTWFYLDLNSGAVLETPPEGYPETVERAEQVIETMPNGLDGYACFDPFTGTKYYRCYLEQGVQVFDADRNPLTGEDAFIPNILDCPVMDGLLMAPSPYSSGGRYAPLFDWVDVSTGELVFRYKPAWVNP